LHPCRFGLGEVLGRPDGARDRLLWCKTPSPFNDAGLHLSAAAPMMEGQEDGSLADQIRTNGIDEARRWSG
jgi:hypothetical protein